MKYATQQQVKQEAQARFMKIFRYACDHQGMTQRQIGDHFGVTDFTVRRAIIYGLYIAKQGGINGDKNQTQHSMVQ